MRDDDRSLAWIIAILLLSSALNLMGLKAGHSWGGDFSWYIAQARAIVEGGLDTLQEYAAFRQQYSTEIVGPGVYPWGYPFLLAPIHGLFGMNLTMFKIYNYAFFVGALLVVYRMLVHKLDRLYLVLTIALLATNPVFSNFKEHVISDIPGLFFALTSILLAQNSKKLSSSVRCIAISVATFMAYWIRTQYILVLLSILIYIVISEIQSSVVKTRKEAVLIKLQSIAIIGGSFGMLFIAERLAFKVQSSYSDHFAVSDYLSLITGNVLYYGYTISDFWSIKRLLREHFDIFASRNVIDQVVSLLLFPLFIIGIVRRWRKDFLYIIVCVSMLAVLLIYPYRQEVRLAFIVVTLYVYFTMKGLEILGKEGLTPLRRVKAMSYASHALFFIMLFAYSINLLLSVIPSNKDKPAMINGPFTKDNAALFQFIRSETSDNASFAFFKPRVLTLLADRKCISVNNIDDLKRLNIDYVILHRDSSKLGLDQETQAKVFGNPVYSSNVALVYKISKFDDKQSSGLARSSPDSASARQSLH